MLISDALVICKKCPKQGCDGCRQADFQSGKREEYKYPLPACIVQTQKQGTKGTKRIKITKTKLTGKEPLNTTQSTLFDSIKKIRTVDVKWQWDKLDSDIITAITNKYNVNGIVRIVQQSKGTVQYRINRLEKEGLIVSYDQHTGLRRVKLFNLTPKARKLLNKPEELPASEQMQKPRLPQYPFSSHSNTLIFPVLEGTIPTSGKPYKMNNWIGHTFDSVDGSHTIKTTTKSIIVEINIELGNMSVANLIMRYTELGKTFAGKFAERFNLKLGLPEWMRDAHNTLKDNALGRLGSEIGAFRTESGISLDRSRSPGDLEMKPQQALGFEALINDVPQQIEHIAAKIDRIDAHHSTTTERANAISEGINVVSQKIDSLPIFIATLQENHELKLQRKDDQNMIFDIKTELNALKTQVQQMGFGTETRKPNSDKWGYHAYQ